MKILFSCKDVSEHTSRYIDQDIPLLPRLKIRLHLFICGPCRNFVQQIDLTRLTLRKLGQTPVRDPKIEELLTKIKQQLAKQD